MNSPSGKNRAQAASRRSEAPPVSSLQRPAFLLYVFGCIAVVVLAAAILANSMTKEIGRDEQMYVTAGVLLGEGQLIYRDFSYPSQLPYHPLLLATLYRGLDTTHYLLAGRLVSAVSDILIVVLILLIYRSIFSDRRPEGLLFGLAAATLYVFNPFVDYASGYAWNHDVVIACVVLALWLLVTTDFQKRSRYWRVGLMGALLTFATCMRVTTALVELAFFAALLWMAEGSLRHKVRTALPFLAGALILAIWPAWVIAQAPRAFLLNLVHIPTLYGRWLHEIGMTFSKIALTINAVLTPACLILLVLAGGLAWVGLRCRSHLDGQEKRKAVVTGALPVLFLLIAYIPPTMWIQYLAVPVPFLAIAFAYPLLALRRRAEALKADRASSRGFGGQLEMCALPGAALLSVLVYSTVLSRAIFVLVPERWEPIRLHRVSREMTERVKEPRLVLTLGPLYSLEGGCDIYPELSSGDIVYRIADRMTPEERRITHTVGPGTLVEMVKGRPPAAVIVGVEPQRFASLEEPLRRLVSTDWHRVDAGTLQVYLRP